MTKTNKSLSKRLKITKNGKIKKLASGRSHYNAKESNSTKMAKKKTSVFSISQKLKSRFLPKR